VFIGIGRGERTPFGLDKPVVSFSDQQMDQHNYRAALTFQIKRQQPIPMRRDFIQKGDARREERQMPLQNLWFR
jgi:hypothetical protein